jgi:hypothetical protein
MRRLFAAIIVSLVAACTGGASPNGGSGTSSSATSPTAAESGDDARSGAASSTPATKESVCSEYIACIAKKQPEMLDNVTAAYGKSGSCWDEMTVAQCEDACIAGKTKSRCGQCDQGAESCLGEACGAEKRCPFGEVCSKGTCIEEVREACESDADCPAPWSCHAYGCGAACLLPCSTIDDCPAGQRCDEKDRVCLP